MMARQRLQQMSRSAPATDYEAQTFKVAVIRPLLKKSHLTQISLQIKALYVTSPSSLKSQVFKNRLADYITTQGRIPLTSSSTVRNLGVIRVRIFPLTHISNKSGEAVTAPHNVNEPNCCVADVLRLCSTLTCVFL